MGMSGENVRDVMGQEINMWYKVRVGNLGEEFVTVFYNLNPRDIGSAVEMLLGDGWDTVQIEMSDSNTTTMADLTK